MSNDGGKPLMRYMTNALHVQIVKPQPQVRLRRKRIISPLCVFFFCHVGHYISGSMEFQGGAKTMSKDGNLRRDYLPGLNAEERRKVYYYAIFPNLLLSLHPDYVMTHTLWPRALDRTDVICEWHFHPDEMVKPNFVADDAVEFWDVTNREDWAISELSQAGIQSRAYRPGPYSRCESLPQAFDQMVLDREKSRHGKNKSPNAQEHR